MAYDRTVGVEGSVEVEVGVTRSGDGDEHDDRLHFIEPGATVGRYVLEARLGSGGMGEVYRARDPQLDRAVAIKVMLPHARGRDARRRARLLREGQAMARLNHPNVVTVHDVGMVGERVFLAMDLVEGKDLFAWTKEHQPALSEILRIYIGAGRGLAAAHGQGLVHRDFKPENVMVDEDGHARVMDFGLVRVLDDVSSEGTPSQPGPSSSSIAWSQRLTQVGALVGTPRFMAAEQFDGRQADARTDQYSYCVALWEALSGAPPYVGGTIDELARAVREGDVRAPVRPMPRWIRRILERGLRPDPASRWPTMDALLRRLEAGPRGRQSLRWTVAGTALCLLGASLSSVAGSDRALCEGAGRALGDVWNPQRRGAVETSMNAVEVPFASTAWERTDRLLEDYAEAWGKMRSETCEATTLRAEQSPEVMDLRMACLQRAKVQLGIVVSRFEQADEGAVRNAHALAAQLHPLGRCEDIERLRLEARAESTEEARELMEARELLAEARALSSLGSHEEALSKATEAETIASAVTLGPVLAEVALVHGNALDDLARYDEAERVLEEGLRIAKHWKHAELAVANGTTLMLVVGVRQQRSDEALRYADDVEVWLPQVRHREFAYRSNLANIRSAQGEFAAAENEQRRALELALATPSVQPFQIDGVREDLSTILALTGELDEAERLVREVLDSRVRTLGSTHPLVARSLTNFGNILFARERYEQAVEQQRQALELHLAAYGPEHPEVAIVRINLADALHMLGRHEDAAREYRTGAAGLEAVLGAGHPHVATARDNLGAALTNQGKYDEALEEHRRAEQIRIETLGPDHPLLSQTAYNLGRALELRGDVEEARKQYQRAYEIDARVYGPDHPTTLDSREELERVRSRLPRQR